MKNVSPQNIENTDESNWSDMPLFNQNAAPQITNNVAPQNITPAHLLFDKLKRQENFGVAHMECSGVEETKLSLAKVTRVQIENNVELRAEENTPSFNAGKTARRGKLQKSKSKKKISSQKRCVVPAKIFLSPVEKTTLEDKAREMGCSLSNFVRVNLGLAPNEKGRKKQNVRPAIDLGDLGFDGEFGE